MDEAIPQWIKRWLADSSLELHVMHISGMPSTKCSSSSKSLQWIPFPQSLANRMPPHGEEPSPPKLEQAGSFPPKPYKKTWIQCGEICTGLYLTVNSSAARGCQAWIQCGKIYTDSQER